MNSEVKIVAKVEADEALVKLGRIDASIRRIHHNLTALKQEAKDAGISLKELLDISVKEDDNLVHMPAVLAHEFGISRSEGRRLLAQGAVSIDKRRLGEEDLEIPLGELEDATLKLGSRRTKKFDGPYDLEALRRRVSHLGEDNIS